MKLLKPKSLFFKILSLCLLVLAGILINSCRKDILHTGGSIAEKALTDHHINIAQLQSAYASGIKGSKQKTAGISGQAIANIISTLNVDWSTYTLQEFADSSKIIEFPMPDDTTLLAPSDAIQAGNSKYKSKTSAVFVLHKDTIILNFFMKTVEDLNDPTYQPALDQQFYLNTPASFNGEIMYFTLGRQFINGYLWKGGSITKAITIGAETTTPTPQTQTYKGKLKVDAMVLVNCTTDYYEVVRITTVTTPYGSTTTTEPTGITFSVTTCDLVDTGTGGSAPSGGVSGGSGTTPPPPPCSTGSSSGAAVASVKNGRLVVNVMAPPTGGTGGTTTTPPQPCPTTPTKPPTTTQTDPCSKVGPVNTLAQNSVNTNLDHQLYNTLSTAHEYGVNQNLTAWPNGTYKTASLSSNFAESVVTASFSWNGTSGYTINIAHTHPNGGAPSPTDIFKLFVNSNNSDLTNAGTAAVNFYKSNASVTVVTSDATYVVKGADYTALATLYSQYKASLRPDGTYGFDAQYATIAGDNSGSTETALLKMFGNSISLYKADANSSTFTVVSLDKNGKIVITKCATN